MAVNQPDDFKNIIEKRQLHNMQPEQKHQHRESIWSVPTGWRVTYFALFTLLSNVGMILTISVLEMPSDLIGWHRLIIGIMRDMAFIGTGSAVIAIMVTENARYTMVIAEWMLREVIEPRQRRRIERWRQEGIQEGRQEGIQEGIKEGRQEGIQEGIKEGRQEGIQEGIKEGRQEGIQEGIKEGRQEGIQEGIKEGDMEWESWISRKMLAESRGEPFDEPMPSQLRRNS